MGVAAGLLGLLYAALHGAASSQSRHHAIPSWVALAWPALAVLTGLMSLVLLVTQPAWAVLLLAVGVLGIAGLAVANGIWLHGRPTWSHHAARLAFAAAVLVPALLSL